MKLRNKRTGEIGTPRVEYQELYVDTENGYTYNYKSLQKMYAEWEDYKEPKTHWIIDTMNDRVEDFDVPMAFNKAIGNYFETKEEAEKAVEKLKAWKRLKDFGCRFIIDDHFAVKFVGPDARKITSAEVQKSLSDSYKLLFGGEE